MLSIAVDGYSSSGKGVVCAKLAKKLGIVHLDTGAIYRVIGLYVKENNINPYDQESVNMALNNIVVDIEHHNNRQITKMNGRDVSLDIRNNQVSEICSITSMYPKCRDFVLKIQREVATRYDLIMEGRDITSHVLPYANFKFFLDADVDVRAKRRYDELISLGQDVTFESVKRDLIERDNRDINREICPLVLTEGTIHIDNTYLTIDEEVDLMYSIITKEAE